MNDVAARACHRCGATLDFDFARDVLPTPATTRTAYGVELAELEVALARVAADVREPIGPRRSRDAHEAWDDEDALRAARETSAEDRAFATIPRVFETTDDVVPRTPREALRRSRAPAIAVIVIVALVATAAYAWWRGAFVLDAAPADAARAPVPMTAPDVIAPAASPETATSAEPVAPSSTSAGQSRAGAAPSTAKDASPQSPAPDVAAATGAAASESTEAAIPPSAAPISPHARDVNEVDAPAPNAPGDAARSTFAGSPSSGDTRRVPPATSAAKSKDASEDARATDRVIRRALGGFAPAPPPAPSTRPQ